MNQVSEVTTGKLRDPVQQAQGFLARYWILTFAVVFGLYVWLPFLAPVFMRAGWTLPGRVIQSIYSTQCHQMPDRSFFLFGPQATYSLEQIQAAWQNTENPSILRQFIGNAQMGWKVAWSDRMVSMYTSTWIFGLAWWAFRSSALRRLRPLPVWGLVILWLPMVLDGGTHFISDMLGGMSTGFRYDNAWLAALTGHALPDWFYAGNALGSFNSDMRILSGILFGLGLVWFAFPLLDESLRGAGQPVATPLPPYQPPAGYASRQIMENPEITATRSVEQNPPEKKVT